MKLINVGTNTIMLPNFICEKVRETKKQNILKIVSIDFTPKSSKTFTHTFTAFDEEFFNQRIGQEIRFWKNTGFEVGGNKFIF